MSISCSQEEEVEVWVRIRCAFWRINYVQLKGNFKILVNSSKDEVSWWNSGKYQQFTDDAQFLLLTGTNFSRPYCLMLFWQPVKLIPANTDAADVQRESCAIGTDLLLVLEFLSPPSMKTFSPVPWESEKPCGWQSLGCFDYLLTELQ